MTRCKARRLVRRGKLRGRIRCSKQIAEGEETHYKFKHGSWFNGELIEWK